MSDRAVNEQLLIAYGRGRASVIYTAAYTMEAARTALERCVTAHGRWVCARIVTSQPLP
jgi:ribosomal protein L16/L10AE